MATLKEILNNMTVVIKERKTVFNAKSLKRRAVVAEHRISLADIDVTHTLLQSIGKDCAVTDDEGNLVANPYDDDIKLLHGNNQFMTQEEKDLVYVLWHCIPVINTSTGKTYSSLCDKRIIAHATEIFLSYRYESEDRNGHLWKLDIEKFLFG